MKLILLVEDDPDLAGTIENRITRSNPFQVHHAESAEEGLDNVESHRYDLMIVDWMLPEMNGPRLLEELREEDYATPALMLTVRDEMDDLVRGLESGADDYMTKPFEFEELEARVRALLRRPPDWSALDKVTAGPLQINTARREALLADVMLDLRKKEFDLLRLLADKSPDVVSRSVIAERVWGSEFVSDNSIDVTISGLRKKIDDVLGEDDDTLRLETVRGVATGSW
jgi:Response regulators consisting of a CheY-like receiver domain and a winged-helix DNA-binding domain